MGKHTQYHRLPRLSTPLDNDINGESVVTAAARVSTPIALQGAN